MRRARRIGNLAMRVASVSISRTRVATGSSGPDSLRSLFSQTMQTGSRPRRSYRAERSSWLEGFIHNPGESPGPLRGRPLCPGNERKEATGVTCLHEGGPRLPAGGRFAAYRFLTNLPGLAELPPYRAVHASGSTNLRDRFRKRKARRLV